MFHRGTCAWVLDRKWFFQVFIFLKRILKERPVAPSLQIWYHHRAVGLPHVSNPQTSSSRNQAITNRFMNLQPESFNQMSKLIKHTDEFIISFKIRAVLNDLSRTTCIATIKFLSFWGQNKPKCRCVYLFHNMASWSAPKNPPPGMNPEEFISVHLEKILHES